jgi:nucleoside phosphorylase
MWSTIPETLSNTGSQTPTSTPPQSSASSPNLTVILPGPIIGGIILIVLIAVCCNPRLRRYLGRHIWPKKTPPVANGTCVTEESREMNGNFKGEIAHQRPTGTPGKLDAVNDARATITQAVVSDIQLALKVEDYTVGWICALHLEMSAAMATFDEAHAKLAQRATDHNTYALGRIGNHNVVVACLVAGVPGSTSAAVVAAQMLGTFPSIRFGLMVGVGGGVPSPHHDIRLGDVVVSNPQGRDGGVVQYDFGKMVAGGQFVCTGSLNKPPAVLLTAVTALRAQHEIRDDKIVEYLREMIEHHPKLRLKSTSPGSHHDRLFNADYDHLSNEDDECRHCDPRQLVHRTPRNAPAIHYGLIASANQVMRDARTRDRLRDEHFILCFEMEAAGLLDNFPCIVIRGICDYADTHKNKRWQEYAAATAAAYTKELLGIISTDQVTHTAPAAGHVKP